MTESGGRMVSFLVEGDDTVSCEVCFEPFGAARPPKILPCGHNFCEQCLFSISCHQQYYLLDSINCPTCRCEFSTQTALSAPTNYDLLRILENVQRGREINVTVIHVPDERKERRAEPSPHVDRRHRCVDCQRRLSAKNIAKTARFCEQCNRGEPLQSMSCLECCVNAHNGHRLLSAAQMEADQLRLLSEMRTLRHKVNEVSEAFDRRIAEVAGQQLDCPTLVGNKQHVASECEDQMDAAIDRLEETENLLAPTALAALRQRQIQNFARLTKLANYLEKTAKSQQPASPVGKKQRTGLSSGPSSAHLRQSRLTLRSDDAISRQSLSTLASLLGDTQYGRELRALLSSISPKDTVEDRKRVFLRAAATVTKILYDDVPSGNLFMHADALLNCYYQLHILSRKKQDYCRDSNKITRGDVWKSIQFAYTELLRIGAKNFPAFHPERVDLVDDLAYLCHLYADVADQASVTICMIEAARARAGEANMSDADRASTHERLKLIDEHLLDCRRRQKLQELRSTKERRAGGLKRLFTACFRPAVHA